MTPDNPLFWRAEGRWSSIAINAAEIQLITVTFDKVFLRLKDNELASFPIDSEAAKWIIAEMQLRTIFIGSSDEPEETPCDQQKGSPVNHDLTEIDPQKIASLGLVKITNIGNENLYFEDANGKQFFSKCL